MKKKIKIIILIICSIGILLPIVGIGRIIERNQWKKAYEAYSNPFIKTQPCTSYNTMHGFAYKGRIYPLMTGQRFKDVIRSQIWFSAYLKEDEED